MLEASRELEESPELAVSSAELFAVSVVLLVELLASVLLLSDVLLEVLSRVLLLLDCVFSSVLVEAVSVFVVVLDVLLFVAGLLEDASEVVACLFCMVGIRVRRVPIPWPAESASMAKAVIATASIAAMLVPITAKRRLRACSACICR